MFGSNYYASSYFGEEHFQHTFGETFSRTVVDNLGLIDSIIADYYPALLRSIIDSSGITDSVVKTLTFARIVTDNEGITDSTNRIIDFIRILADSGGLTDELFRLHTICLYIADNMGITDTLRRMVREGNISISPTSISVSKPGGEIVNIKSKNSLELLNIIGEIIKK